MQPQPACPDRYAGFTLVEMLIAIAIFGIMSTVTYRVLNTMLATRERVSDEYRRWRDVARAVAWMERDLEAVQARPVRDATDRLVAPLVGTAMLTPPDDVAIAFTRRGDPDESGYASAPRRVGYRVRDGTLERLTWTGLDQAPGSAPTITVILSGVAGLGLRYRVPGEQSQSFWPGTPTRAKSDDATSHAARSGSVDTTLPAAVDITIQLANGARIAKLVPLCAGARR